MPTRLYEVAFLAAFLGACGAGAATSNPANGGMGPATGGAQGTGGAASTGGVPGTGGNASTGGAQGSGGNASTGGGQGTGGNSSTGGRQGTGGNQNTGGAQGRGGVGGRASTGGTVGAGGGAGAALLGFAADIWPVFSQMRQPPFVYRGTGSYQGCTAASPCHGSANPGARLSMIDSDTAYRALVQVASTSSLCAGAVRVIPGNPEGSCLVRFYQGRLKDDLQWVPQSEIELMRRWIADGARP